MPVKSEYNKALSCNFGVNLKLIDLLLSAFVFGLGVLVIGILLRIGLKIINKALNYSIILNYQIYFFTCFFY